MDARALETFGTAAWFPKSRGKIAAKGSNLFFDLSFLIFLLPCFQFVLIGAGTLQIRAVTLLSVVFSV
jgi:hypothetical protein